MRDLLYAVRLLRKHPGFTAVAVLSLALGIGANTAVFSVINTILFRPLPVERPEQLVYLNAGRDGNGTTMSYPDYRDYRDRNNVLSGLMAFRISPISFSQGGANARIWGYLASGNYFQELGIQAILGRTFIPDDDRTPGGHPVAVISYASWKQRFGGDPAVVGKIVKLNGLDFTILGVTPAGFGGTELLFSPEVWAPMMMEPQIEPGNPWLERRETQNCFVIGRLKDGVTQLQAEAALNSIARDLSQEHLGVTDGKHVKLSAPGLFGSSLRTPMLGFSAVLLALAGLVLLIACTNIGSLLLARGSDRRKEIAVRLSLGASRAQLLRQLLTESLVLSIAGGIAGCTLGFWIVNTFSKWRAPVDVPLNTQVSIDARVLVFTAVLSVFASILFGLVPALQATRTEFVSGMKNSSNTRVKRLELRDVFVTAQIALSVLLLTGSVLAVQSLREALRMNLGFNPQGAVSVAFDLALQGYDEQRGRQLQQTILEKVSLLPGIQSAGLINSLPLTLDQSTTTIYVEGKPEPRPSDAPSAMYYNASPGYFRTMQTRFLAGRDFENSDRVGRKPVVIVNETFVHRILQGENAIGSLVRMGRKGTPKEIVGVVENGKYRSLGEEPAAVVFFALAQNYNSTTTAVARSSLPPHQAVQLLRSAVAEVDPNMPLFQVGAVSDQLDFPFAPARLAAAALSAFGALAIVLAATGVYGVMAYTVARRTREIGIRISVGATSRSLLHMVLTRGALLLIAGIVVGSTGALALGNLFSAILYGVSPRNPLGIGLAAAMVTAIAAIACWIPARRAARVDPVIALKEE